MVEKNKKVKVKVVEMALQEALEQKLLQPDIYIEITGVFDGWEKWVGGRICHVYPDKGILYLYDAHTVKDGEALSGTPCPCEKKRERGWVVKLTSLARIYLGDTAQAVAVVRIHRTPRGVRVYAKSPKLAKFLKLHNISAEHFPSLGDNLLYDTQTNQPNLEILLDADLQKGASKEYQGVYSVSIMRLWFGEAQKRIISFYEAYVKDISLQATVFALDPLKETETPKDDEV